MKLYYVVYVNTQTGKIERISLPQLKYDAAGFTQDGSQRIIHVYEDLLPDGCKEMSYFMDYHWFDSSSNTFKFTGLPPNKHSRWDFDSLTWVWNDDDLHREIRLIRNQLLSACDWTQALDAPLSEQELQSWRDYRQQLRDITRNLDGVSSAQEVNWPQKS
jgi:hypothetical protein